MFYIPHPSVTMQAQAATTVASTPFNSTSLDLSSNSSQEAPNSTGAARPVVLPAYLTRSAETSAVPVQQWSKGLFLNQKTLGIFNSAWLWEPGMLSLQSQI